MGCIASYFSQGTYHATEGQLTDKLLEEGVTDEHTDAEGERSTPADTAAAAPDPGDRDRPPGGSDTQDDAADHNKDMLLGALGATAAGAVTVGAVTGALKAAQDRDTPQVVESDSPRPAPESVSAPLAVPETETGDDSASSPAEVVERTSGSPFSPPPPIAALQSPTDGAEAATSGKSTPHSDGETGEDRAKSAESGREKAQLSPVPGSVASERDGLSESLAPVGSQEVEAVSTPDPSVVATSDSHQSPEGAVADELSKDAERTSSQSSYDDPNPSVHSAVGDMPSQLAADSPARSHSSDHTQVQSRQGDSPRVKSQSQDEDHQDDNDSRVQSPELKTSGAQSPSSIHDPGIQVHEEDESKGPSEDLTDKAGVQSPMKDSPRPQSTKIDEDPSIPAPLREVSSPASADAPNQLHTEHESLIQPSEHDSISVPSPANIHSPDQSELAKDDSEAHVLAEKEESLSQLHVAEDSSKSETVLKEERNGNIQSVATNSLSPVQPTSQGTHLDSPAVDSSSGQTVSGEIDALQPNDELEQITPTGDASDTGVTKDEEIDQARSPGAGNLSLVGEVSDAVSATLDESKAEAGVRVEEGSGDRIDVLGEEHASPAGTSRLDSPPRTDMSPTGVGSHGEVETPVIVPEHKEINISPDFTGIMDSEASNASGSVGDETETKDGENVGPTALSQTFGDQQSPHRGADKSDGDDKAGSRTEETNIARTTAGSVSGVNEKMNEKGVDDKENVKSPVPSVQEEPVVKVDRFRTFSDETPRKEEETDEVQTGISPSSIDNKEPQETVDNSATNEEAIASPKDLSGHGSPINSPAPPGETEVGDATQGIPSARTPSSPSGDGKALQSNTADEIAASQKVTSRSPSPSEEKNDSHVPDGEQLSPREPEETNVTEDVSERTEDNDFDPLAQTQSMIFPYELAGGRESQLSEKPSSPFPGPEGAEISDSRDSVARKLPPDAEQAATKIQAGVRGWQARRKISQQQAAATQIQAGFRGWRVRKKNQKLRRTSSLPDMSKTAEDAAAGQYMDVDTLRDRAAAKIQAGFRGWRTRQEMKSLAAEPLLGESARISPAISMSEVNPEVEQAAARIQAGYRGWKTRRQLKRSLSDPNSEALVLAEGMEQRRVAEVGAVRHPEGVTSPTDAPTPREDDETAHSIQSIQSEVVSNSTTPRQDVTLTDSPRHSDPSADRPDSGKAAPSSAEESAQAEAAAKIQAGYRGWKTRQQMRSMDQPAVRPTESAKSVTDSGALPIDFAIVHRPEDDWLTQDAMKQRAEKEGKEGVERESKEGEDAPDGRPDSASTEESASSWLTRAHTEIRASFQGLRDNVSDALRTVEDTAKMVREKGAAGGEASDGQAVVVKDEAHKVEEKGGGVDAGQVSPSGASPSVATGAELESKMETPEGLDAPGETSSLKSPSEREEEEIWEEIQKHMHSED